MKQKVSFASVVRSVEAKPIKYEKTDGVNGVRFQMMIFSTAWNRNKAYFQVADLLRWSKKTSKIFMNFNHDLEETGGQYLGNKTKIVKNSMKGEYSDGSFEIFATFESTDDAVISRVDEITAPSIELEIDTKDYKQFEDGSGFYFTDFELVGVAFLTGFLAGSGDARLTSDIEKFSQTLDNTMQFKTTELQTFFETEEGKVVFAELVDKYESKTESKETFKAPDGTVYQSQTEYIMKTVVTNVTEEMEKGMIEFKKILEDRLASFKAEEADAEEDADADKESPIPAEGEKDEAKTETESDKAGTFKGTADLTEAKEENFQAVSKPTAVEKAGEVTKVSRYTRIKNNLKNIL